MLKKISLTTGKTDAGRAQDAAPTDEILELFFNTGVAYHTLTLPAELPDLVSSFVIVKPPQATPNDAPGAPSPASSTHEGVTVRRALPSEDPDVEIAILEHLPKLVGRWVPVPYQLSSGHAVQIFLSMSGGRRGAIKAILAIDTLESKTHRGRFLDANLDGERPFRPLERDACGAFFEHAATREYVRKLERSGLDAAPFKLAALYELLGPYLPRLRFSTVESHTPIPVSLVLDFGNSRSTAVLVEAREKGLFATPLEVRSSMDPFTVSDEAIESRITFLPSAFEDTSSPLGTGEGFTIPSVARLGREALDRSLETPHRYACSLSSPKRYLWSDAIHDERWHFAIKQQGEYRPVFGRLLKYLVEESGGTVLRQDGPSAPPEPRYAHRTMMLFGMAEILSQAYSQIASPAYRRYQGREGVPRILRHVVLTYPSGMRDEEKEVYDKLVENAVILVTYLFNIPDPLRPNVRPGGLEPFLFVDEALAAQMVFVYQEVTNTFANSMEDFIRLYGAGEKVRIASCDIGGGTTDIMVADYSDRLPGAGSSVHIKQVFQDGLSIAGDEVCRALVEDIVFPQILAQMSEGAQAKSHLIHLFGEGDGGHGADWRTLKAKLVPFFWMPLARILWSIAEGFEIPGFSPDRQYTVDDVFRIFESATWSPEVLAEVDRFLEPIVPKFPGLRNLAFRFDRQEIERVIEGVLREPLRRYSDILAQLGIDLLVLAGRASALPCVKRLFVSEMPVAPPRIRTMSDYRVGDWYPSKWQTGGVIRDPKSTVAAGAAVLHLAAKNQLAGFMLDSIEHTVQTPIYGLYQESEPHIGRESELFRKGNVSDPIAFTGGMRIGYRNVDSQEMDATPLFEVRPASPAVEAALVESRVTITFERDKKGQVKISAVKTVRGDVGREFTVDDFVLKLKTLTTDRYWLDTGVLKNVTRYL